MPVAMNRLFLFQPLVENSSMQPLSHLESFVQSAESGSFSAAARRMGLTPAAVSKNVARLEANLSVRLFQRSTRRLVLTEGGQRLLQQISTPLATLADAVEHAAEADRAPAGTLKVSMGQAFGRAYLVPLFGAGFAWLFLNEPVTPAMLAAGALILGSVAVSQRAA